MRWPKTREIPTAWRWRWMPLCHTCMESMTAAERGAGLTRRTRRLTATRIYHITRIWRIQIWRSPSKKSCMIFLPTQTSWLPTAVASEMNRSIRLSAASLRKVATTHPVRVMTSRVAAAVLQKNVGPKYVTDVMERAGLSPGSHTATHAEKLERERKRRRVHQGGKKFKRRRLQLKSLRSGEQDAAEVREGVTYSTGCDMSATPLDESSTESIPPFMVEPRLESVQVSTSPPLLVIFDIETTSLSRESELTQLAAVNTEFSVSFSEFVLPTGPITSGASSVTGLTTNGRGSGRRLCKHGKPVSAVDSAVALKKFLDWLLSFKSSVILVAHNCHQFDLSVFLNAVLEANLDESFDKVVVGFADTLPLLRKALPGKASYALPALFADVVGGKFSAHDAAADTEALLQVTKAAKLDLLDPDGTANLSSSLARTKYRAEKSRRRKTLQRLVDDKVVTVGMADKIAAAGLAYCHLQLAFRWNPENGLRLLLTEKCPDGKPRVTAVSRIHQALVDHFNASSAWTLRWFLPPPPPTPTPSLTHNIYFSSFFFLPASVFLV